MSLRDYGLPKVEAIGIPTWVPVEVPCPNCGAPLCQVQVRVRMANLRGGEGMSTYLGCPACPFASPTVTCADPRGEE